MCGIIGTFTKMGAKKLSRKGLKVIDYRGQDGQNFLDKKEFSIGHCLHSIVGEKIKQPLTESKNDSSFVTNCEIYNWKELSKIHNIKAKNDAELMFKLFQKKGVSNETLQMFDGVYAFCFIQEGTAYIARDIIGVKPIWFSHNNGFYFASEKKALEKLGLINITELNPRKILKYEINTDSLKIIEREFFTNISSLKDSQKKIEKELEKKITSAIEKRIPQKKFGLLFSGGVDSTTIAKIIKNKKHKFICYTVAFDDPNLKEAEDLVFSKKIAKDLNLKLKIIKLSKTKIKKDLKTIVPLIEDSNVVKVEVALTFFSACEQARKDGCKVLFSGLGSEEIFAGYQRHKESPDVNKECLFGLLKLYERDLYRDDVITMFNQIELRLPFLDKKLVEYALKIPGKYKLKNGQEKFILRQVAKNIGLKKEFFSRKKKAAQYGSNVSKIVKKLTKKNGFKFKSEYLKTFYKNHNLKLGAMISSGKDGIYAMEIMLKQNCSIDCIISIKSNNQDSYMFHTPNINLVELQAKAMELPLLWGKTPGDKEKELTDLKKTLEKAKKKFGIEGIVTGAIFSTYQRDRIEKICDELSLKTFSPLWHMNQETEMRSLINNGFHFIFSSIAAYGLNKSWLGKEIKEKDIDKLVKLNEKIGLNIAGEGGEFESLVLDCPLFKKKIKIKKTEIIEEDENTARLIVKDAVLIEKRALIEKSF